jgi:hypothetical protein
VAYGCGCDGVPCFGQPGRYVHLKGQALKGGRDQAERGGANVWGLGVSGRRGTSVGRHQPGEIALRGMALQNDADPRPADAAILRPSRWWGSRERLEFTESGSCKSS